MKKLTLLPLVLLLTFALWLPTAPTAEEWVIHKTLKPGGDIYFNCVAFSPSGSRLVVGREYSQAPNERGWTNVTVYDGSTFNKTINRVVNRVGMSESVQAVACRQGWWEAAIGVHQILYLMNTKSNPLLWSHNPPGSDWFISLAYRRDGKLLAAGTDENNIFIYNSDHQAGQRRLLRTLRGHTGDVTSVAWSPDGRTLASGSKDGTVRLWNPNNGINFAVLRGHTESVRAVAWSRDGQTLASGGTDSTVRIWNVDTGRTIRTIRYRNWVNGLRFHPRQNILGVVGSKGVGLYNPSSGQQIQYLGGSAGFAFAFDFHPNGTYLAYGGDDGIVRIWKKITVNRLDANKDGRVDINDLIEVAKNYGKTGTNNADVNGDGRVDVKDFIAVAKAVNPAFAAPTLGEQQPDLPFTAQEVQQWIQDAKTQGIDAAGIAALEQLLAVILHQAHPPKETALLANYPNPFNPETWIPYQLAQPAEVTVSIHAADGTLVRTLALGQLPAGVYQEKDRAAYWDGTNEQGEAVASGVYFYTLKAGDFSATKKMLIQK